MDGGTRGDGGGWARGTAQLPPEQEFDRAANELVAAYDCLQPVRGAQGQRPVGQAGRLLAVPCAFQLLTFPAPPHPGLPPDQALRLITSRAGTRFDPRVVRLFTAVAGFHPVGTLVRLPGGPLGVVMDVPSDPRMAARPRVRVIQNAGRAELDSVVDLAEPVHLASLDSTEHDLNVPHFLFSWGRRPAWRVGRRTPGPVAGVRSWTGRRLFASGARGVGSMAAAVRPAFRSVLVLVLGLLSACGPSPESITFQPLETKYLRTPGQNVRLDFVVLDAEGKRMSEPKLRWTSSATDVALVADGVVTVRKSGKTTIGVTGGKVRAALPLDLTILNSLDVRAPGADFMEVGRTIKMRVVARNEQGEALADAAPVFHSSDETVVRVENGELVAVQPGTATVSATLGHLSRGIAVQVVPADFARLGLNLTHHAFRRPGESVLLQARAYNRTGGVLERVPLEWFTSDASVVTVSPDGRVTAVGPGRAVVSVVAGRRRTAAEFVVP